MIRIPQKKLIVTTKEIGGTMLEKILLAIAQKWEIRRRRVKAIVSFPKV
jgi:hypothetical protein